MDRYVKILIATGLVIISCEQEPDELPNPNSLQTDVESLLTQSWRYREVIVDYSNFNRMSSTMEVSRNTSRNDISKRRVVYDYSGFYQLQWDNRGEYDLGTNGDPNWQPRYGNWSLNGDTLTHSPGQNFETKYFVELGKYRMTRSHLRFISGDQFSPFTRGITLFYAERFINEERFLAGTKEDTPSELQSYIISNSAGSFGIYWMSPDVSDLAAFDYIIENTSDPSIRLEERIPARHFIEFEDAPDGEYLFSVRSIFDSDRVSDFESVTVRIGD